MRVFSFTIADSSDTYTFSLHDALPISCRTPPGSARCGCAACARLRPPGYSRHTSRDCRTMDRMECQAAEVLQDRKSTRLNSSHITISYAVFCLKKKTTHHHPLIYDMNV